MAGGFKHYLCSALLIAALVGPTMTMAGAKFPGQPPDRRIMKTQEKVDSLFERGDYERAMFIYRNELAPLGDKYAQYMIGFMYLTGKGVSHDLIEASAWYRLAAERGHDAFVGERDELMALLRDEQQPLSDSAYRRLRQEFSDMVLLSVLIKEDLEILRAFNRSRARAGESFQNRPKKQRPGDEEVVNRLQERLDFLLDLSVSGEFDAANEREKLDSLATEVLDEIRSFEVAK